MIDWVRTNVTHANMQNALESCVCIITIRAWTWATEIHVNVKKWKIFWNMCIHMFDIYLHLRLHEKNKLANQASPRYQLTSNIDIGLAIICHFLCHLRCN